MWAAAGEGAIDLVASSDDQVILALIALVATSIAALVFIIRNGRYIKTGAEDAAQPAEQATSAANAVNHVEYGEHRLYDVVARIEAKQIEFDRKWGALPESLGNAVNLSETLHDMNRRLDDIQTQLADHVAWETNVKWPASNKEVTP